METITLTTNNCFLDFIDDYQVMVFILSVDFNTDGGFFLILQYKGKLYLEPCYDNLSCSFLWICHNCWIHKWEYR